jgi:hypothetical protein
MQCTNAPLAALGAHYTLGFATVARHAGILGVCAVATVQSLRTRTRNEVECVYKSFNAAQISQWSHSSTLRDGIHSFEVEASFDCRYDKCLGYVIVPAVMWCIYRLSCLGIKTRLWINRLACLGIKSRWGACGRAICF